MKKFNNRGFMMAELLAVAVVVLVIFTVLFTNFVPTKGEYEKRIEYNDVESLYANYYLKVLLLRYFYNDGSRINLTLNSDNYLTIIEDGLCLSNYSYGDFSCQLLANQYNISDAVITKYKPSDYSGPLSAYINYLDITENKDGELLRLTIKTKTGYSSDKFYSIICNIVTYGDWGNWQVEPCTGDSSICESDDKKVNLYNNGTAKPTDCDTNPLCYYEGENYYIVTYPCTENCDNIMTLYRTRRKYISENDSENFSISPC